MKSLKPVCIHALGFVGSGPAWRIAKCGCTVARKARTTTNKPPIGQNWQPLTLILNDFWRTAVIQILLPDQYVSRSFSVLIVIYLVRLTPCRIERGGLPLVRIGMRTFLSE